MHVARRPFVGSLRRDLIEAGQRRDRRHAALERRGKHERLERGAGLAPAAAGAIERGLLVVAAADQGEDVAGRRIDRHQRGLQRRLARCCCRPLLHRRFGGVLQLGDERRLHAPVGRMIAAEFIAEPLPQVGLRIAVTGIAVAAIGPHAQRRLQRGAILLRR